MIKEPETCIIKCGWNLQIAIIVDFNFRPNVIKWVQTFHEDLGVVYVYGCRLHPTL